MKSPFPLLALAALAACKQTPEVIDTRPPDPNAAEIASRAPVVLPPSIRSQKTYRCADNSLVYVTWFVGDKTVNVRTEKNGPVTTLLSATAASPWTSAVGWTLAGDDGNIRVSTPGQGIRDCHP